MHAIGSRYCKVETTCSQMVGVIYEACLTADASPRQLRPGDGMTKLIAVGIFSNSGSRVFASCLMQHALKLVIRNDSADD